MDIGKTTAAAWQDETRVKYALVEALEAMLVAYAPRADETAKRYGEACLHSAVKKARKALRLAQKYI